MSKPRYFGVKCPKCGWIGSSEEAAGGHAIADTGDFCDLRCPKNCLGEYGAILEDAEEHELCDELKRLRAPVESAAPTSGESGGGTKHGADCPECRGEILYNDREDPLSGPVHKCSRINLPAPTSPAPLQGGEADPAQEGG